jgi:hypothetical protein
MQQFISGLPQAYRDRIEFDGPRTLEEAIWKARYCYEQMESKTRPHKAWKKMNSLGFQKKRFNSSRVKNYGKYSRGSLPARSVYQQNFPSQSGNKLFQIAPKKTDNLNKEPLKCWGCGENHKLRDCPHRKQNSEGIYNMQEATTINNVARTMP